MQRKTHLLPSSAPGTRTSFESLHFGTQGAGRKAYLHTSLHADEPPGMLVLHHLGKLLQDAERANQITGEIILVPIANPIGLAQRLMHRSMGRFELNTSENFNRNYPDLRAMLAPDIFSQLGQNADANRRLIRAQIAEAIKRRVPTSTLDGLRQALVQLAFDADIVLDLHCDNEGVMHLYTETPYWPQAEPLARYLGARVTLLAEGSGSAAGGAFDEALSGLWWRLPRDAAARGLPVPVLPLATFAVTVELRGQADVTHDLAQRDARNLFSYLCHEGLIAGPGEPMPALLGEPTPLAGSIPLLAPHAGVVAFHCKIGTDVTEGMPIADVIDPMTDRLTTITAPVSGCFYARMAERFVHADQSVGRIAGAVATRSGSLLSA